MGASQTELTGPDLAQGVPLAELPEGEMLLGHAQGEPVLVVRRGEEVLAIGATCTHYGGPLAEGLLVGDTVRCPWHHACFSLRTGEAVRAPALHPVPCWRVERRGAHVYVTEKMAPSVQTSGLPHARKADEPASIVIVGAGAAGDAAAEMLRREGYTGRVTLLGADDAAPYDRPNLSKDYLAGTAPEEWIPLRSPGFYDEMGVTFVPGAQVTAIDPAARQVVVAGGAVYGFDRLLLATGAEPVRLSIPGGDLPHVHYLRTLADSRAVIARAQSAHRAVVVGAGFIGLEVAAALRTRGIEVHVVAPEAQPMERVFGPELARFIRALHSSHGVVFHLEQTVAAVTADAVTLASGAVLPADLVVFGVGVRPRDVLAREAGLEVDNGVVVDRYLETSVPGIYAAGDVARWPDPRTGHRIRVEHWVVAQRQGQVAARNMLGRREPFDAVPFFWSQHYDVPIVYVGHAASWDRIDVAGSVDERDALLAYRLGGKTLAVAGIYRDQACLQAEVALEQGDERRLQALVPPA